MKKLVIAALMGATLAGCGSNGGDDDSPAADFAGAYSDGESGALIRDSGEYHFLQVDGGYIGHGTLTPGSGNSFASADLQLFRLGTSVSAQRGSLSGAYVQGVSATVEFGTSGAGSDPLPSGLAFDSFNGTTPAIAEFVGEWDGSIGGTAVDAGYRIAFTISATGDIASIPEPVVTEPVVTEPVVAEPVVTEPVVAEPVTATPVVVEAAEAKAAKAARNECTLSGKLTPVKGGFSVQMSFGAAPCPMAGQSVEGSAFRTEADEGVLRMVLFNAASTEAALIAVSNQPR